MAIEHFGTGKEILGGQQERGGTLKLLIPAVLMVDGLLLLQFGRSGGNLPVPGRRSGVGRVTWSGWRTRPCQRVAPAATSPAEGSTPGPTPGSPAPTTTVVEQLASFRDIGTWLSPGLGEGAALPGAF